MHRNLQTNLSRGTTAISVLVNFICLMVIIGMGIKMKDIETYCIQNFCSEMALNRTDPGSYINQITKPFLIELVKNATINTIQ